MSHLFKLRLGSTNRKMLAVRLADFADDEGQGIWPSVARLSLETELSERTVQRILGEFVDEGLLQVVKKASGRPGETNRYDFNLAAIMRLADVKNTEQTGDTVSPLQGENQTGDTMTRVSMATQTGDTDDIDGCHRDTRTVIEPLDKPLSERDARESDFEKDEELPQQNVKSLQRSFKRWYGDWPTRKVDSAAAAEKAWLALTDEQRAACIEKTPAYVERVTATKGQKVPYASLYLNGRDWEKLEDPRSTIAAPIMHGPYTRAWNANRLFELLQPVAAQFPAPTALQRQTLELGGAAAEAIRNERIQRYGWPRVNTIHERLQDGKGVLVPPHVLRLSEAFGKVKAGSDLAKAWQALHARRNWPPLPTPQGFDWLWLPAVAEGEPDLDAAVEAAISDFSKTATEETNNDAA